MLQPAPESRGGLLFIVLGNLMVLPLAVTALVELKFFAGVLSAALILVGLGMAILKYDAIRRRWQLGPPLLCDASDGSGIATARFIFSPRYGRRLGTTQVGPDAALQYKQMVHRRVNNIDRLECHQQGDIGSQRVEYGIRSVDFNASLPPWPADATLRPAHWEFTFSIAGASLVYRVHPGFGRQN
jgi:hypothetical protein